jgi:hypothetical protein
MCFILDFIYIYIWCTGAQKKQHTVTRDKKETDLIARGRHDPCVVPRGMSLYDRSILQMIEISFRILMIDAIWSGLIVSSLVKIEENQY